MAYDHPTAMMRIFLGHAVWRSREALNTLGYIKAHHDERTASMYRRQADEWVRMAEESQALAIGWASR